MNNELVSIFKPIKPIRDVKSKKIIACVSNNLYNKIKNKELENISSYIRIALEFLVEPSIKNLEKVLFYVNELKGKND